MPKPVLSLIYNYHFTFCGLPSDFEAVSKGELKIPGNFAKPAIVGVWRPALASQSK
jgi:hypothetical protein